ncbi:FMN-binding protein [Fusibacter paucivorans]|uniref:FMN-binding protein n=1 Tax=Fusibacter paucivorans TaxID=76009 RepID=A0ABS5PPQ2_9FIRM|nr:FMN-binding protein [Fusibacter paucivorans]MBS7526902.1 FMN-binding protein [Fusibacter paucivorans]
MGKGAGLYTFLCILALLFFVVGKYGNNPSSAPEEPSVFTPIFLEYDQQYEERLPAFEDAKVHRVYKLAEGRYGFLVTEMGYESEILFFIEVGEDAIEHVDVLSNQETADYGGYVTETWFLDRLLLSTEEKLKVVRYRKKNENEVVAITGATQTSKAAVKAVNRCIDKRGDIKNDETI